MVLIHYIINTSSGGTHGLWLLRTGVWTHLDVLVTATQTQVPVFVTLVFDVEFFQQLHSFHRAPSQVAVFDELWRRAFQLHLCDDGDSGGLGTIPNWSYYCA